MLEVPWCVLEMLAAGFAIHTPLPHPVQSQARPSVRCMAKPNHKGRWSHIDAGKDTSDDQVWDRGNMLGLS